MTWGKKLLHRLLPTRCVGCESVFLPGPYNRALCLHCFAFAFKKVNRCIQCGLRLGPRLQAFGWTRCRFCRQDPQPQYTWAAADYTEPFSHWVQALKYHQQIGLAHDFGTALAITYQKTNSSLTQANSLPDLLVPIPSSPQRLRQRGYNQAELIAQTLGKNLGRPVSNNVLSKPFDTASQAQLNADERKRNLNAAFQALNDMKGYHIGLVDDVSTTGATLSAARAVVMNAGAKYVSQWIVFRTPENTDDSNSFSSA